MRKSVTNSCSVCAEARKSRTREFSPHAWSALSIWGEVTPKTMGQPICEGCYRELRDLLIERTDELERMSTLHPDFANVHEIPAFLSSELPDAQIAS